MTTPIYRMPDDAFTLIAQYLSPERGNSWESDRWMMATAKVCKAWNNNPVLKEERQKAAARICLRLISPQIKVLSDYSSLYTFPFLNTRFGKGPLPTLPLTGHNNGQYITVLPKDMKAPVMQFKDPLGRPGFALHLKGRDIEPIQRNAQNRPIHVRDLEGVVTFFRRYPHSTSHWATTFSKPSIEQAIQDAHLIDAQHTNFERCPTCPFSERNGEHTRLLRELLTDQNRVFKLKD